jgi:hypothetical protein
MTDLERFQRQRFAQAYERVSRTSGARGTAGHRARLLGPARGRVIEIGAGNGLNLRHYPPDVTEVPAVEPEDRTFDAAVFSLVLCSVPDPATALTEARRVRLSPRP